VLLKVLVDDMVDMFVLLCPPGAGDELQGIKRGIMEMADLVVITKADGALAKPARQAKVQITQALQLQRPKHDGWRTGAIRVSSLEGMNVDKTWELMNDFRSNMEESGEWESRRIQQRETWMWNQVQDDLRTRLENNPGVKSSLRHFRSALEQGQVTPREAATKVVEEFLTAKHDTDMLT